VVLVVRLAHQQEEPDRLAVRRHSGQVPVTKCPPVAAVAEGMVLMLAVCTAVLALAVHQLRLVTLRLKEVTAFTV
jgi:hypothetical protein